MEERRIDLRSLYLDSENPRFVSLDDEPAIIKALVGKEKILELAADLLKIGPSPLERLAVMPHPTAKRGFVVLEGNRRVCAAKLLADPQKAPTEALRKQFAKLAGSRDMSSATLDVIVFPDRASARPWIERRHTGQKDGIGSRKWEAAAITRFSRQDNDADPMSALALALVDYAQASRLISAADRDALAVTTVTRMLSTPAVRDALGIDKDPNLGFYAPADQVNPAIQRFLKDIRTGVPNASSRTNAENRKQYAHQLRQEGVSPTTRWPTSQPAGAVAQSATAEKTKSEERRRDSAHPDRRKHVIPTTFSASIRDARLRRIYGELKALDCDEFPFAASSVLRTFIDLSARQMLAKAGKAVQGDLHVALLAAATELGAAGVRDAVIKPLRVMGSQKDSRMSAHSLGAVVHASLIPEPRDLKRHWDEIEPVMQELLARH